MRTKRGFTLIELMVSIALVLILILGVNKVFQIATDSVNAGQAISDISRDNRGIQTVLYNDFQNGVIRSDDMPCFVIRSSRVAAFLDREEMLGDIDYQSLDPATATPAQVDAAIRSIDIDGNNSEADAGEMLGRNNMTARNYRQDVMCFFARHLYPRQTGNDGTYAARMSSNEAFVWYGHLRQPTDWSNTAAVNMDPGPVSSGNVVTQDTNPNNFYARQWGLGRVAVLLRLPDPTTGLITDDGIPPVPQQFIRRSQGPAGTNYSPLGQGSSSPDGSLIEHSRYDLAGTNIDTFASILKTQVLPAPRTSGSSAWYSRGGIAHRFAGYPQPFKPMSSYGVARTVPWLVGGCTSFMVEYAGDFLNQNETTGAVLNTYAAAAGTDGRIDFHQPSSAAVGGLRTVRWYGFPRDLNGNGIITAADGDVVPFSDFNGGTLAPFEHTESATAQTFPTTYTNPALDREYVAAWQPPGTYRDASGNILPDPPKPRMIRVTLTMDDARGRLPGGQSYEYVIELP
jgi:prepilin-type N-terminal cleavage/methylation domain-containing protein